MSELIPDPGEDNDTGSLFTANEPAAPPQPTRRGPGRPRKDGSAPGSPRENVTPLFAGTATQKPKGPPKKNIEPIKKFLVSVHDRLALVLDAPYLAMEDSEAQMLAEAGSDLLGFYKIKIDGKQGAMLAFVWVILMVYGPRVFAFVMMQKMKGAVEKPGPGHNGGPPLDNGQAAHSDE